MDNETDLIKMKKEIENSSIFHFGTKFIPKSEFQKHFSEKPFKTIIYGDLKLCFPFKYKVLINGEKISIYQQKSPLEKTQWLENGEFDKMKAKDNTIVDSDMDEMYNIYLEEYYSYENFESDPMYEIESFQEIFQGYDYHFASFLRKHHGKAIIVYLKFDPETQKYQYLEITYFGIIQFELTELILEYNICTVYANTSTHHFYTENYIGYNFCDNKSEEESKHLIFQNILIPRKYFRYQNRNFNHIKDKNLEKAQIIADSIQTINRINSSDFNYFRKKEHFDEYNDVPNILFTHLVTKTRTKILFY